MSTTESFSRFSSEVAALSNSNARSRLAMLFDNGCYTEIDRFAKNNGSECEVVAAFGEVNGTIVYAYAQSADVNRGAMGKAQAAKITHVYDLATKTGAPVIAIFDSNGAHISEGIEALEAYGDVIKAAGNVSGVVPQISVVAGPCIGSSAVLASLADVVIMTKDAEFFLTAPVTEGEGDSAAVAAKGGVAALVVDDDKSAVETAADILAYLPANNLSVPLMSEYVAAQGDTTVERVVDAGSFLELYAEYGLNVKTGFARVGGVSVGVIATNPEVNDGYICTCGAKKAAKFVRLCDAYSIPVITIVDSMGLRITEACDCTGGVKSVALLTAAYSEATTAKITLVTGNAYAGAYVALVSSAAAPDMVFAWSEAAIGSLEPKTAVQLLYKERMMGGEKREDLEAEYITVKCSPFEAAALGCITDVISAEETAAKIANALDVLSSKRVSTLSKKHTNISL